MDLNTIKTIANEKLKAKGVTELTLETDRQLLKVTAAFDVSVKPGDIDTDAQDKGVDREAETPRRRAGRALLKLSDTSKALVVSGGLAP